MCYRAEKSVVQVKHKQKEMTKQSSELFKSLATSLGNGFSLRDVVKVPSGIDPNCWIAMNSLLNSHTAYSPTTMLFVVDCTFFLFDACFLST